MICVKGDERTAFPKCIGSAADLYVHMNDHDSWLAERNMFSISTSISILLRTCSLKGPIAGDLIPAHELRWPPIRVIPFTRQGRPQTPRCHVEKTFYDRHPCRDRRDRVGKGLRCVCDSNLVGRASHTLAMKKRHSSRDLATGHIIRSFMDAQVLIRSRAA